MPAMRSRCQASHLIDLIEDRLEPPSVNKTRWRREHAQARARAADQSCEVPKPGIWRHLIFHPVPSCDFPPWKTPCLHARKFHASIGRIPAPGAGASSSQVASIAQPLISFSCADVEAPFSPRKSGLRLEADPQAESELALVYAFARQICHAANLHEI